MTKQPSHSGERPMTEAAPDSGEQPFDPSHFGKHEFPVGLREELIRAEKPRIDPKFLQDTVPPNRKPVLTEAEQPVTTPRGGFAAPRQADAVDRDAPTLIAPSARPSEVTQDAVTLIKVPTVKAPQSAVSKAADSPSAPPVDTSRSDPTIVLPGVRKKKDNRGIVIGVVAVLAVLFVVGMLVRPDAPTEPAPAPTVAAKPPEASQPAAVAAPAVPSTKPELSAATAEPAVAPSPQPSEAPHSKEKTRSPKSTPQAAETKVPAPSTPKPTPAPNAAGKQPWIDGL
jgi:hypothetical protein